MDPQAFFQSYPRLYHMAHHAALPGILKHGLLSTSALLDLFECDPEKNTEISQRMRRDSVVITHKTHGRAVIRDQKPIGNDQRLASALNGSARPAEWHLLLNSKVFFWVDVERLNRLRNARAYRKERQLILTLDTEKVVASVADKIWLCGMNSGCCMPFPHPRTPAIFERLLDFDLAAAKTKRGPKNAVVECAVEDRLRNVESFIVDARISEV